MASVFITGMTAPQCSPNLIQRSASFSGEVYSALSDTGVDVTIGAPSADMTAEYLTAFDKVIVGVSPILSLTANYAYGALSVISTLINTDPSRLVLAIDTTDPGSIRRNLTAVDRSFLSLFKPLYSARKEHSRIFEDKRALAKVEKAVEFLLYEWHTVTLYPSTPFAGSQEVESLLFGMARGNLRGVNLDAFRLREPRTTSSNLSHSTWCVDNDKTKWFKSVSSTMKNDYVLMKQNKGSSDIDVDMVMRSCIGAIISPGPSGAPWWSRRYSQAMQHGLPICTEWRYSSALGEEWAAIPASIEHMSAEDRRELADAQRSSYLSSVKDPENAIWHLLQTIGLDSHDNVSV
jgi:hypothetical protein